VAVEQTWQDRRARGVDALVAVQSRPDRDDPPVLDDDVGVGGGRPRSIEDLTAGGKRAHVRDLLAWGGGRLRGDPHPSRRARRNVRTRRFRGRSPSESDEGRYASPIPNYP